MKFYLIMVSSIWNCVRKKRGFLWPIFSGKEFDYFVFSPLLFLYATWFKPIIFTLTWKPLDIFCYKLDNSEISHQLKSPASFKDIEDKKGND